MDSPGPDLAGIVPAMCALSAALALSRRRPVSLLRRPHTVAGCVCLVLAAGVGFADPENSVSYGLFGAAFCARGAAHAAIARCFARGRQVIEARLMLGASDREAFRPIRLSVQGSALLEFGVIMLASGAGAALAGVLPGSADAWSGIRAALEAGVLLVLLLSTWVTPVRHGRLRDEDAAGARPRFGSLPPPPPGPGETGPMALDRRPDREEEGGFPRID